MYRQLKYYYDNKEAIINKGKQGKYSEYYQNKKKKNPNFDKARYIKRKYGLTLEDYTYLYQLQKGRCRICKIELAFVSSVKEKTCIDHCHKTNAVRGLLCSNCNCLLGFAKDNILVLKSAISYLQNPILI